MSSLDTFSDITLVLMLLTISTYRLIAKYLRHISSRRILKSLGKEQ